MNLLALKIFGFTQSKEQINRTLEFMTLSNMSTLLWLLIVLIAIICMGLIRYCYYEYCKKKDALHSKEYITIDN